MAYLRSSKVALGQPRARRCVVQFVCIVFFRLYVKRLRDSFFFLGGGHLGLRVAAHDLTFISMRIELFLSSGISRERKLCYLLQASLFYGAKTPAKNNLRRCSRSSAVRTLLPECVLQRRQTKVFKDTRDLYFPSLLRTCLDRTGCLPVPICE